MVIKVVHLDDEEYCLELTREIMAMYDRDIQFQSYTSPKTVIEKVKKNEPDLILSDYQMPEMNGIEFTRKVKRYSNVPVIMYTGCDNMSLEEAFEAGVHDVVKKAHDVYDYLILRKRIKNSVDSFRLKKQFAQEMLIQV